MEAEGSSDWPRGNWILPLRSYYRTKAGILICPTAKKRLPNLPNHGSFDRTYLMGTGGMESRQEEGSYGANCWIFNVRPGQTIIHCMWRGGGPFYQNNDPHSNRIRPADFNGQWLGAAYEMMHFAIDRHNGTINHAFFDWSVRAVDIKELWTFKWHRTYDTSGFWTKMGGVQPGDWPRWMRNFKEH